VVCCSGQPIGVSWVRTGLQVAITTEYSIETTAGLQPGYVSETRHVYPTIPPPGTPPTLPPRPPSTVATMEQVLAAKLARQASLAKEGQYWPPSPVGAS